MDSAIQEKIINLVREKFESEILSTETPYNFLTINLKPERIKEVIRFLYDHPEAKFRYLTTLCGIHYPEAGSVAMMYQLHSLENNWRIRLKIYLPQDQPETSTITDIFSGANWMERETYDFFGVKFTGHPDLRRILNVEEMIIHPLRKEYPLEDQTREDKTDLMFGR